MSVGMMDVRRLFVEKINQAAAWALACAASSPFRSAVLGLKNMVVMYYRSIKTLSRSHRLTFLRYLVVVPTPRTPFRIALAVK
jgi:hypothetical protein